MICVSPATLFQSEIGTTIRIWFLAMVNVVRVITVRVLICWLLEVASVHNYTNMKCHEISVLSRILVQTSRTTFFRLLVFSFLCRLWQFAGDAICVADMPVTLIVSKIVGSTVTASGLSK